MRLRQPHQVADRPGDDVAVADQATVSPALGPEHARDVPGHRRLLGDHGHLAASTARAARAFLGLCHRCLILRRIVSPKSARPPPSAAGRYLER